MTKASPSDDPARAATRAGTAAGGDMTKASPPDDLPGTADAGARFARLVEVMRTLRSPGGCAWDREQTVASLRPFVLEEAYEVVEAMDRDDRAALCEELGDLLLEAVFVAQVCAEDGDFTIADAAEAVTAKLIRRHPHVFGDAADLSPAEVKRQWERIKRGERAAAADGTAPGRRPTLLDGIPEALPSLLRASRIGARAANVGFDWDEPQQVVDKADEEIAELRAAIAAGDPAQIEEEMGDLLFTVANAARKLRVDPESALRTANAKFTRRFRAVEQRLEDRGRTLHDASPDELEREWEAVKTADETAAPPGD